MSETGAGPNSAERVVFIDDEAEVCRANRQSLDGVAKRPSGRGGEGSTRRSSDRRNSGVWTQDFMTSALEWAL